MCSSDLVRIADRSVLRLIRMWLQAPPQRGPRERPEKRGGQPEVSRSEKGTPQGGVASPLLANLYLHWFDRAFQRGPAQWTGAKLVRYADDFVVMARQQTPQLIAAVESLLEGWMGLKINRDKTRVVNLNDEGTHLDFLGYTFAYVPDRFGRQQRYLNWCPSAKALARERAVLRDMTHSRFGWKPIGLLIQDLNRHLVGWANYFHLGYPRAAFREINSFVRSRLYGHLRRRSQRPIRPAEGSTWYRLIADLGFAGI